MRKNQYLQNLSVEIQSRNKDNLLVKPKAVKPVSPLKLPNIKFQRNELSNYSPEKQAGIELFSILTPTDSNPNSLEKQENFLREVFHSPSIDEVHELDITPPLRSDNPIESDHRFSFEDLEEEEFDDRMSIGAELGLLTVSPTISSH
eukprot:gene667-8168_t